MSSVLQSPANSSLCAGVSSPRSEVSCHVPCPQDCIVSPWSPWSDCPPPVCSSRSHRPRLPLRQRNRTVLAGAGPGGLACPASDSLMEMGACPDQAGCDWYRWGPAHWEECQLAPGYQCGKGLQTRKVHCKDAGGSTVPDWRCSKLQSVSKRRSCSVPCPRDCEVSGWTEWSRCPDLCQAGSSEGGQLLMEIQRRERVVLVTASHGGEECPDTSQVRPCPLLAGSCREAAWWRGDWSNCSLPRGMTCGEGLRTRPLSCSRAGLQWLGLAECLDREPVPAQSETCSVSCSDNKCQLSSWSSWSSCPQHQACSHRRRRERTSIQPHTCRDSHLDTLQEEPCPCDTFTAKPVGAWSACIPDSDSGGGLGTVGSEPECGAGRKYRRLECYDSKAHIVEAALCGGSQYLEEACHLDCPQDCKLSEWSAWGLCDTVCGPGLRNRTSRVVQRSNKQGRPCPGPTVEYDTCHYPCHTFSWQAGPWSHCNIQHGHCGLGQRRRTVR